jgi:hypothetical protein
LGELRNTEELITEKQVNSSSNITLDNIYNAIRYLNPKEQFKILENYKFTELYSILADKEEFEKYISDLRNISHEYFDRVLALMSLYTKALEERRKQKLTTLEAMNQTYDSLSEEEKQKFCMDMLAKQEFFEDSCKVIMDVFGHASEVPEEGVNK